MSKRNKRRRNTNLRPRRPSRNADVNFEQGVPSFYDCLRVLTHKYNTLKEKTIFDQPDKRTPMAYLFDGSRIYEKASVNGKLANTREEVKQMDCIDVVTKELEEDMKKSGADYTDLPPLTLGEELCERVKKSWYLAIPPLEKGVLRINRDRYIVYEIKHLSDSPGDRYYEISIFDYQFMNAEAVAKEGGTGPGIWFLGSCIAAKIQNKKDAGCMDISTEVRGMPASVLAQKLLEHGGFDDFKANEKLLIETVVIPAWKILEREGDSLDVVNHFLHAIVTVNGLLDHERPKAKRRRTGNKVKIEVGEVEKSPKPQLKRVFTNGMTITSKKCPKAPAGNVVRHYTVAEWTSRGHIRHYKDGRQVYVKPSVKHRKCFKEDEGTRPQAIIQLASK